MQKTAFIYSDEMTRYDFGPNHPLRPVRLTMTRDLSSAYGLFDGDSTLLSTTPANEHDILTIHDSAYVEAVKALSRGESIRDQARFGFGPGDNPPFAGMYEASLIYTGASLTAADLVIGGEFDSAFSISGGLHHAMPDRASGFCIFNDPAVAIHHLLEKCERVVYIDIDAHHGDGVQEVFYQTDRVLTISIHESGEYLFPGTGDTHEIGEGPGRGYSVNIPLAPNTSDEIYLRAFEEIVPPLISAYDPQAIVAQLGADTHFTDPLAHINLTSDGYVSIVRSILGFGRPLVALGGGGYNVTSVARLWTLTYAEMLGVDLPDEVSEEVTEALRFDRLRDPEDMRPDDPGESVHQAAEQSVREIRQIVFPIHGLSR